MSDKKPWNLDAKITAAIRKLWKQSPMRLMALSFALINPEAKAHLRKYRCARCQGEFHQAAVEVNHKSGAVFNETWDEFIFRMFCGITNIWYCDTLACVGGTMNSPEPIVREHLEVLCKECHSEATKAQRKGAKNGTKVRALPDKDKPRRKASNKS
jgi:5-methylcytosine-specific restriction endonuclease McrA